MDPKVYVPAYLERMYLENHPNLTDAARDLLHEEVVAHPETYATTEHAANLLAYARVHTRLIGELDRMEDLPDEEFERKRDQVFRATRLEVYKIWQPDRLCIDAQLLDILLADVPIDACLHDLLQLEERARDYLRGSVPGFDTDAEAFWKPSTPQGADPASATRTNPEVIGWLHVCEALAQECLASARYRAAAQYARLVMRAKGYPNRAVGTLLLALARLEDEDGFFAAAHTAGEGAEDSPWYLLGRTLLLYKLARFRNAQRALKDFVNRCEGGAFFLLNPTYMTPYLPVRPAPRDPWSLTHQAVWEADGIIVDTPDFSTWAASVDGVDAASEAFARKYGF